MSGTKFEILGKEYDCLNRCSFGCEFVPPQKVYLWNGSSEDIVGKQNWKPITLKFDKYYDFMDIGEPVCEAKVKQDTHEFLLKNVFITSISHILQHDDHVSFLEVEFSFSSCSLQPISLCEPIVVLSNKIHVSKEWSPEL
jgi:hypothetical protein